MFSFGLHRPAHMSPRPVLQVYCGLFRVDTRKIKDRMIGTAREVCTRLMQVRAAPRPVPRHRIALARAFCGCHLASDAAVILASDTVAQAHHHVVAREPRKRSPLSFLRCRGAEDC